MLNFGLIRGFAPPNQGIDMRLRLPLLAIAAVCAVPTVAVAHDHGAPPPDAVEDAEGRTFDHAMPPQPGEERAQWESDRAAWLDECRARMDERDDWSDGYRRKRSSGVAGAVVGGVAGGLLGRGIAGRDDKVLGTVAGAVVGAAAGAAIERASSSGRDRREGRRSYSGDYCEQYFNYYTQQGWGHQGHGYGTAMMMVPVMFMQGQGHGHGKHCKETIVTEEWVTVRPPARVHYHRVPDKRVRIVPDKRLPMK
jgi:hypothetical protein